MKAKVKLGNCLDILKTLPDDCIDMVLTSPPYDGLRTYNGYSFEFEGIAKELARVLKTGGVIIWIVGDATKNGSETGTSFRQALTFMSLGLKLHDTMIYEKQNYVPLTHNRYEQAWEYMFCLSKGKPITFNPIMVECKTTGGKSGKFYQTSDAKITSESHTKVVTGTHKIASNIFRYTVGHEKTGHPAVFPLQLALDHITTWSNPDDLILDPFCGSGTSGVAAIRLGRNFLGIEISEEYRQLSKERISKELEKCQYLPAMSL